MMGRRIKAQLSNVMIWKSVNMAGISPPKYCSTRGSFAKVSVFTTSSIVATANMKCTVPMITPAQKSRGMHSMTPFTSIHNSWKTGIMRTARHSRVSRRMRSAAKRWTTSTSTPAGMRMYVVSTPTIHTTKASNTFMGSKIHTQENAMIRRMNSRTKMKVKMPSESSKGQGFSSPGLNMASQPIMAAFMRISTATPASNLSEETSARALG
mmetsp:Transcript_95358/g.278825  ORF Transcript_95358/g.278825 Transcript_95358/m.278825 type:complete len:210 (+) Transcript_95358:1154-1783(+)